jgi:hypothetical protein
LGRRRRRRRTYAKFFGNNPRTKFGKNLPNLPNQNQEGSRQKTAVNPTFVEYRRERRRQDESRSEIEQVDRLCGRS